MVAAVLESGEEIGGGVFFSSAGGAETEALARGGDAGEEGRFSPGAVSIAEGIALLDAPPAKAGLEETIVFYSCTDEFVFGRPEGLVEARNFVVCAPGNYRFRGASDAPGENILKVTRLASHPAWRALGREAYARAKRAVADGMAAAAGAAGLDVAAARGERRDGGKFGWFDDVFTPLTLERFTSHAEGALYGGAVKSRTGETAWENLFLIGTDQGFHGIVGAMLSGVAMANRHCLAKRPGAQA